MTVFEYDGKLLIVDCGVLFPDVDQPGVDLILPDFASILDRLDDVQAIVLTHGHEDHIGARAVPAARTSPTSRWSAPSSPSRWSRRSCAERRIEPYTLTVARGAARAARPVRRASSSRSTTRSRTRWRWPSAPRPALVLHTGDFKMDQLPLDGRITDLAGFARLGAEGVDLLLSDSTNAEIPGFVTPEREIGPVLDSIFAQGHAAGSSWPPSPRTCTGCSRCSTRPHEHGRKVAFIGRSMVRNMGIARDLGLLQHPGRAWWSAWTRRPRCRRTQIVLMSTGSQGEPMSALGRMANGDHRHVTIEPGRHRRAGSARWCRATRPRSTG